MLSMLNCPYFEQKKCSSCQWIHMPYEQQLTEKYAHLTQQLNGLDLSQLEWLPPYTSQSQNFRNKAKMVVSGSVERPVLGILSNPNDPQSAVDLSHCLLYPKHFADMFTVLKTFIGRAGLVPYNIAKRKGELKYILLTESQINGTLMVRFVLRSTKKLSLIQRELPQLLEKLPQIKVVSLNIQPKHAAVLEGEEEIFLTKQKQLEENFNQIPLFIRPQGFFQTNPKVAEGLYRTAQQWVKDLPIQNIWDLFCGVGGFGLHCAKSLQKKNPNVVLTGIEISPSAITSAKCSAEKLGLHQVKFQPLDATNFALAQAEKPDLLIVNPPRRGIGKELAQFLNKLQPHFILYSSCNAQSMGQDLKALTHYQVQKIQLFDMFPHTAHYEVLVLFKLMNK